MLYLRGRKGGDDTHWREGNGFEFSTSRNAGDAVKAFAKAEVLHRQVADKDGMARFGHFFFALGEEEVEDEVALVLVSVKDERVESERAAAEVEEVGGAKEVEDGAYEVVE